MAEPLLTETNNPRTVDISRMTALEMLTVINREDQQVALAVEQVIPQIAEAVERALERVRQGGRVIYAGAGTSGRLGVIDASEIPCTYGVGGLFKALIAGGQAAVFDAASGDEDDAGAGEREIITEQAGPNDIVVGIAASGRTPYVLGALRAARARGSLTIAICNNSGSAASQIVDVCIAPLTGPEVVEGSTRMKAGTSQKLILNMFSTALMIRLGHVYRNYMVNMIPNNDKLRQRACAIVAQCAGVGEGEARATLQQCGYTIRTAVVMLRRGCGVAEAESYLQATGGALAEL